MAKRYYISFDTKDMAPKIKATWVEIGTELIHDMDRGLPINLRDHPKYRELYEYCRTNPPPHRGD